jgi:hypothetical protein
MLRSRLPCANNADELNRLIIAATSNKPTLFLRFIMVVYNQVLLKLAGDNTDKGWGKGFLVGDNTDKGKPGPDFLNPKSKFRPRAA